MIPQERLTYLLHEVEQTQHGFLAIRKAADEMAAGSHPADVEGLARQLFADQSSQKRMLAVFLLGSSAARLPSSLAMLHGEASHDPDWRVQEIVAQAFDAYCAAISYETALPTIQAWLNDPIANVRRAASEGLRIWTSRPYFKTHPEHAIALLSALRADPSEYVRKSVGNALRDISRKHAALIEAEVALWDRTDPKVRQTYMLASKFLK